jgi:ATP-dependent helicase HrpA
LTNRRESLPEALAAEIAERFRIALDPAVWAGKQPPEHLRVRVRVRDEAGRELVASRELADVRAALLAQSREASVAIAREDPMAWRAVRAKWETAGHTTWVWDEMPERVLVTEQAGAPAFAFPGLQASREGVARKLFKTPEEATAATRRATAALLDRQLGHDLGWTQRDLRALREIGPLASTLAPLDTLQEQAFESVRRWVTERRIAPLNATTYATVLERAKTDLRGLVPRLVDLLREILTLRQELLVAKDPPAGLLREVEALVAPDFLRATPFAQLAHFPRYLKAMKLRAERWRKNPGKDAERVAQIAPYAGAAEKLRSSEGGEAFRWLVEEFRVSLFAQELGTAEPVSAVKLDRARAALQGGKSPTREPEPAPAAKPIVAAAVTEKKATPIKNLSALDKLFGR